MSTTAPSRLVDLPRAAGTAKADTVPGPSLLAIGRVTVRLLLVAMSCVACKSDGISGAAPASSKLLPESPGQFIAAGLLSWSTQLRWERDEEITYTGGDERGALSQLRVVHVGNGTIRVIDTAPTREAQHCEFEVSPDGRHTFFVLRGTLYHTATDSARVPIANVQGCRSDSQAFAVLPGADAPRIVYRTATDSAWHYDARSQTKRLLTTGCPAIVALSPDGTQLLCKGPGETSNIVDIGSGAVSPTTTLSSTSTAIQSIHWGPRGIEHIRSGAFYFTELVNGGRGTVATLIASSEKEPLDLTNIDNPRLSTLAWSRDGRRIAYSRELCYATGFKCVANQSQLHVYDIESKVTRLAAVVARDISSITFSPDGTRIAYIASADGTSAAMYVAQLP